MISFNFFLVAAGIFFGSVRMACAKADPHLQERPFGMAATVWRTTLRGVLGILQQHGDDLVDGDGIVMRMPAIVVGDHGDGDVAEFSFASELGFLQVGHADDVHAPRPR